MPGLDINVRPIALWAALLPFLAVNLTYLLAASQGLVDWCFPYIDSCTSISATGRHPPASYLFRATMIPAALFMMAYWWLTHAWLAQVGQDSPAFGRRMHRAMLILGVLACLGLIMYVTVLGEVGQAWRMQRRTGAVLFFSFTFLAQLLLVAQLRWLRRHLPRVPAALPTAMLVNCITLLLLGVLTVILDAWDGTWYDTVEDAFEWVLALLLQVNFLFGYLLWRRADWRLTLSQAE
jgi:hypothetical protein